MNQRPKVHICTLLCKLRCLFGHCVMIGPAGVEGKCRCCKRFNKNTAHELSRSRDHRELTVGWWTDDGRS